MIASAIIAGAGIGGLTTAVALARRNVTVDVLEQATELTEVGAGIQLSPNAMRVLASLGLEDAILAKGFEPETAEMRHWRTGRRYMSPPLRAACRDRYGAPYIHIHRADLQDILVAAVRSSGGTIHLGRPITAYHQDTNSVYAETAAGPLQANVLIGADGIHSTVRTQMLGAERPVFTGQVAWRCLIPAEQVPAGVVDPAATVWVGPGRHLVTYLVRGGAMINVVAVTERTDWHHEDWLQTGNPADMRNAFSGWHADVTALLDAADQAYLWALFDRPPLPRWQDGHAVLLGDACHPALPFMAQGAAMAIEDAVVLTDRLSASNDVPAALRVYEAKRKPRTSALQALARRNAGLFHLSDRPGGLISRVKLNAASMLPGRLALRPLDWIYGFDAAASG